MADRLSPGAGCGANRVVCGADSPAGRILEFSPGRNHSAMDERPLCGPLLSSTTTRFVRSTGNTSSAARPAAD